MAELTDTQALPVLPLPQASCSRNRRHPDPRDRRGPGPRWPRPTTPTVAPARAPHRRALRPRRDRRRSRGVGRAAQRPRTPRSSAACTAPASAPASPAPGRGAVGRGPRGRRRPASTRGPRSSGRELRGVLSVLAERRRSRAACPSCCARPRSPARSPTASARGPTCRPSARSSCSRRSTPRAAVERALELGARRCWPSTRSPEQIRHEVGEGMEKQQREFLLRQQLQAIRKELGEGATTATRSSSCREKAAAARPARGRARRGRQGDRQARAHRPSRTPSTAGSARGSTRSSSCRGACAPTSDSTSPKPARVLDADHTGLERREGPHRRVPGGAQAARRSRASTARDDDVRPTRRGERPDPRAGRSAGRRQDVARRVGRARDRPVRSCASPSAACATRRRSAVTGAPTSARCRAASPAPSRRPGR